MKKYKSRLLSYITPELLFLCWRNLLITGKDINLIYVNEKNFSEPLSKNWFKKTSALIKSANFNYEIFNKDLYLPKHRVTKTFLNKVKCLIIQNAFIFVLRFQFDDYFSNCYNFCDTDILI